MKKNTNKGFSLVELIVVIAIMAIIAGVAIPVFSHYIEKANKASDADLVDKVKYSLTLAAIDGTLGGESGSVILTENGCIFKDADGHEVTSGAIYDVVTNGFAASDLKLKYDEWTNNASDVVLSYTGSSFSGKEGELLDDIQSCTNAIKNMLTSNLPPDPNNPGAVPDTDNPGTVPDTEAVKQIIGLMGSSFSGYLSSNGIDTSKLTASDAQKVANHATLFVADQVTNLTTDQKKAIVDSWKTNKFSYGNQPQDISNGVERYKNDSTGLSTMGALAVFYANTEAMVQYVKANSPDTTQKNAFVAAFNDIAESFRGTQNPAGAFDVMAAGYTNMLTASNGDNVLQDYIMGYCSQPQAETDAKAFVATMGAVNESAPSIGSDMNKENMYSDGTVEKLLTGYISSGEALQGVTGSAVAVIVAAQSDGSYDIKAYPVDYID